MRIFCLIKHVRDTETRIKVVDEGKRLEFIGDNKIISPYDEFAVEEALKLKEKFGGEVISLTVGDDDAIKSLRQAMAMGADSSIFFNDSQFFNLDPLSTAKVIAKVLEKEQFDLILAGKHGVGDDNQAVPSMIGAILGIPVVTVAVSLEIGENFAKVKREIEGGFEIVSTPLPAIITCQKGLNEPRYPSLKGIMAAKKKEIKVITSKDISIDSSTFNKGPTFKAYLEPPPRPKGRIIEGEPKEAAKELVKLLHEEAKVI